MLECGSLSMDEMFCSTVPLSLSPLLPAAALRVDQSSFTQLPVEEQLRKTQRELEQLKDAFGLKISETEDMAQELHFFQIKNEELMDVIHTSRCPSDATADYTQAYALMKLKSEQNAELTLTVQQLRDLFDKAGHELGVQQQKVTDLSRHNAALASIKRAHQQLQLQVKGLLKTVNNCADVPSSVVDIPSEWMNTKWMMGGVGGPDCGGCAEGKELDDNTHSNSIQLITRKIITMEADRQRLLKKESLALISNNNNTPRESESEHEKEERTSSMNTIATVTASWERKVRQQQYEQDVLQETNSALRRQLSVREGKISALEELFQTINASRSLTKTNTTEGGGAKTRTSDHKNNMSIRKIVEQNNSRGYRGSRGSRIDVVVPPSEESSSQYRSIERSMSLINYDDDSDDSDDSDAAADNDHDHEHDFIEDTADIHSLPPGTQQQKKQQEQQSFEVIFTNIWTAFSTPVENMQHLLIGNNSNNNGRSRDDRTTEEVLHEDDDDDGMDNDHDHDNTNDLLSCDDLSTVTEGVSSGSGRGDHNNSSSSYHTRQVEEELQAAAQQDYEELQHSHFHLQQEYDSSQVQMTEVTARLAESRIKATSCEKKAELREDLLKDVIQQYKELQFEHATSQHQLHTVQQQVVVLLQLEKEHCKERKQEVVTTSMTEGKNTTSGSSFSKEGVVVEEEEEESPTVDMSDDSSSSSTDSSSNKNEEDGSSTSSSSSSSSSVDTTGKEVDDNLFIMADYKRLEWECDKLQQEFETAVSKVTLLEEQLQEAKTQTYDTQQVATKKAHTIVVLEKEKAALQERIIEVTTNMVETKSTTPHTNRHSSSEVDDNEEVKRAAELRYQQARDKQLEREQDLWDVIEQYKQLAETNESTSKEKEEMEKELLLTQKAKFQRRDLVYEYRKLEKDMEEAVITAERLSSALLLAKNDAAKSKEEAKGIRKRLAGCHFHYKHLQQQYDILLREKDTVERQLQKAHLFEALRKTQLASWQGMMETLRDKRDQAEEKAQTLSVENDELQLICDELLLGVNHHNKEVVVVQKERNNGKKEEESNSNKIAINAPSV